MIFAIGFILFLVGMFMVRVIGNTSPFRDLDGPIDHVGTALALIGIAMMMLSICILSWRYLP